MLGKGRERFYISKSLVVIVGLNVADPRARVCVCSILAIHCVLRRANEGLARRVMAGPPPVINYSMYLNARHLLAVFHWRKPLCILIRLMI